MEEKYAVFNGETYKAISSNGKIKLLSETIESGFVKDTPEAKYYVKLVEKSEVSEYFSMRRYAIYKGINVAVRDEKDNELLLYSSHHRMPSLGFDTIERGEYQKWVSIDKVDKIWEEKRNYLD